MSYAKSRDAASNGEVLEGLVTLTSDVTTVKYTVEIDRDTYGGGELLPCAELIAIVNFTTAAGAPGDEVDITVAWQDSAVSGSGHVDYKSTTLSVVVDANDGAHTSVVVLPVNLVDANRYIRGSILVAAGTGAPTVSPATAACAVKVFPSNGQPTTVYNDDGTIASGYDKDGYENTTIN